MKNASLNDTLNKKLDAISQCVFKLVERKNVP